jgi:septal ring-binding cell division protein DamX
MPVDLYSSLKKTSQWAFGSPFLNSILGSSFFVAVTVALIMILIIMIMYPAKSGTPFSIVFKMFIYMLCVTLIVVFLHDGVIKYMMEAEQENNTDTNFMRNTTMEGRAMDPSYGSSYKTINPTPQPAIPSPVPSPAPSPVATPTAPVVSGGDSLRGFGKLGGVKPPNRTSNPYV